MGLQKFAVDKIEKHSFRLLQNSVRLRQDLPVTNPMWPPPWFEVDLAYSSSALKFLYLIKKYFEEFEIKWNEYY